jgi:hypothetical protein
MSEATGGKPFSILISGGAVHARLDAVKIITNRFRGGLMSDLADRVARLAPEGSSVAYLTAKGQSTPKDPRVKTLLHDGFDDYFAMIPRLALEFDAMALGAAVANLVPAKPWAGKFPSHHYSEGEEIQIPFKLAPRAINEAKKANPKLTLFGFKLLAGVADEELIDAAWTVMLASKAQCVFANDAKAPLRKLALLREGGVMEADMEGMARLIVQMSQDEHYRSETVAREIPEPPKAFFEALRAGHSRAKPGPDGLLFGTVAARAPGGGFWCTGRGKKELEDIAFVERVDHERRAVVAWGDKKASLNAPLLARILERNPGAAALGHWHDEPAGLPALPYAPAGTVRDSLRELPEGDFVVASHGCFELLDANGLPLRGRA